MIPRDILAVVLILVILETTVAIEHGHPIKTIKFYSLHWIDVSWLPAMFYGFKLPPEISYQAKYSTSKLTNFLELHAILYISCQK